jgi:hypothetical protein
MSFEDTRVYYMYPAECQALKVVGNGHRDDLLMGPKVSQPQRRPVESKRK